MLYARDAELNGNPPLANANAVCAPIIQTDVLSNAIVLRQAPNVACGFYLFIWIANNEIFQIKTISNIFKINPFKSKFIIFIIN